MRHELVVVVEHIVLAVHAVDEDLVHHRGGRSTPYSNSTSFTMRTSRCRGMYEFLKMSASLISSRTQLRTSKLMDCR